jgi:hypothetical protein
VIVVRIYQLRAMPGSGQSWDAIEMRVNHAFVVVIGACVNVLKRGQQKSQRESQAGL